MTIMLGRTLTLLSLLTVSTAITRIPHQTTTSTHLTWFVPDWARKPKEETMREEDWDDDEEDKLIWDVEIDPGFDEVLAESNGDPRGANIKTLMKVDPTKTQERMEMTVAVYDEEDPLMVGLG